EHCPTQCVCSGFCCVFNCIKIKKMLPAKLTKMSTSPTTRVPHPPVRFFLSGHSHLVRETVLDSPLNDHQRTRQPLLTTR
ncbi:Hypothetical predicted protein, partial [Pelobates cultripes]